MTFDSRLHITADQADQWFDFTTPSARFATVNDLVVLKALFPDSDYGTAGWGLKEFGYLVCLHACTLTQTDRFLDVGVGCGRVFDRLLPDSVESWAIDEPGFYAPEAFEAGLQSRARTTFRPGLLGRPGHGLPEDHFAQVSSISVLEHAFDDLGSTANHDERLARAIDICEDTKRLLKPDGLAVHTIDVATTTPWIAEVWTEALVATGLIESGGIDLSGGPLDLAEPISIQHTNYYGPAASSLQFPIRKTFARTRTLLVIARPGCTPEPA